MDDVIVHPLRVFPAKTTREKSPEKENSKINIAVASAHMVSMS
jgi:hypothetical protein